MRFSSAEGSSVTLSHLAAAALDPRADRSSGIRDGPRFGRLAFGSAAYGAGGSRAHALEPPQVGPVRAGHRIADLSILSADRLLEQDEDRPQDDGASNGHDDLIGDEPYVHG